jgi:SAM-dependent methyltransferase
MQSGAMFVDPMAAKYGAQPDGYPSVHDGLSLVKSDACESGYKGVSVSRAAGSITCFQARDGSCMLGAFPTRVEAAVAFARSRETTKDVRNHQRQERRQQGKKRKHAMSARPEVAQPREAAEHYGGGEAQRYTAANAQVQHELAMRCTHLLESDLDARNQLLLDLGCGSCLSSRVLTASGQRWIGLDVSREMLLLADRASLVSGVGALLHSDLGTGLPLRPSGQFDGAISVSALQWLCEPPAGGSIRDVRDALHRLFTSLHGVLRPGAAAVFQFYTTPAAAAGALEAAVECGFRADLIIDLPHATRARKLFLCVRAPLAPLAPIESPKETRVARARQCEEQCAEPAGVPPSVPSVPRVCRRVCPIAWPFGAACICCSGWLHAPRPPIFPSAMAADGDTARDLESGADASGADAWLEALRQTCRQTAQHSPSPLGVAKASRTGEGSDSTMDSASAAAEATTALERLQHQHMKYVRRSLHALHEALHSQTDVVSEGANAEPRIEPGRLAGASAAASEVHLYMGADERTGDVSKAGVDLDLDLASAGGSNANASDVDTSAASCDEAMLISVRGTRPRIEALVNELIRSLRRLARRLEHANCTVLPLRTKRQVRPSAVGSGSKVVPLQLVELPIPNAPPHALVHFSLEGAASHVAGRLADCIRSAATRGLVTSALEVDAMDWQGDSLLDEDPLNIRVALALRRSGASGVDTVTSAKPDGTIEF